MGVIKWLIAVKSSSQLLAESRFPRIVFNPKDDHGAMIQSPFGRSDRNGGQKEARNL